MLRLNSLTVSDYKALGALHLNFPEPSTPEEPDVWSIGGRNGIGKSAVLECCAIAAVAATEPRLLMMSSPGTKWTRSSKASGIQADFNSGSVQVVATPYRARVHATIELLETEVEHLPLTPQGYLTQDVLLGEGSDAPILRPSVLFFHQDRRLTREARGSRLYPTMHSFLWWCYRDKMFMKLVTEFGRRDPAATDFMLLSSGQKEIIALLWLIWYATKDAPAIVLVDGPEMYLNAEWQRILVPKLLEIAPKNQYILATHSEEIFGAIAPEKRIMLEGP